MRSFKVGAALSCAVLFSVIGGEASNAATIQNFDAGWYTNSGFTGGAGNDNINVGSSNLSGAINHNWLGFNITGLAGQIVTSATLTFYGGNGVNTSSTSETLGLFDYTGSINAITSNSQFNVGIYNDLGNGNSYGTAVVPASGNGLIQQFSITLSQAAIADLNAAAHNQSDTRFVIGGALLSISGPYANEQLFATFGAQRPQIPAAFLDLETAPVAAVPEPSTWAMMILGFAGVGFMTYRRRKAAVLAA
ncbi:MAG: PEPxxWA-CTERM sorting domain-containing protein [Bradyrhizobium sp.]|nr:PEPxxWA-CTERM sorting domain-containing protein [Bradyrhizobium sp.]